jgi:uncharacterized protein DUF6263
MSLHWRSASALLFLSIAILLAAVTAPACAQEPLRWKFTAGERLAYDSEQDMTINVTGVQGGDFQMGTEQKLNLLWDVLSVDEQGNARIRQKLDRVRLKMTGPAAGQQLAEGVKKNETVEYDSQVKDPPIGGAAMAAAMFEPMMKETFELTVTPRGEVKDVKVPPAVMEMVKRNPEIAKLGDMATDAGVQKMLMQEIVVLPEGAPKEGETWNTQMEMPIPVVGKQTIETTYTYQGTKDLDGKQQATIAAKRNVKYGDPQAGLVQVAIKEQSSDGETLFNVTDGRLNSATLNQQITIEASGGGQAITQKLDQKSKVTVRPAETSAEQPAETK